MVTAFESHKEQVNEIAARTEAEFLSCSNDGLVLMWDTRAGKKPVRVFNVREEKRVVRSGYSKGVFTVAHDDQFMVGF